MASRRIILSIEGMSRPSCAATVQQARSGAGGVAAASVDYATAKAAVEYDADRIGVSQLAQAVGEAGNRCGTARRGPA